jgi:hypothetical protein
MGGGDGCNRDGTYRLLRSVTVGYRGSCFVGGEAVEEIKEMVLVATVRVGIVGSGRVDQSWKGVGETDDVRD